MVKNLLRERILALHGSQKAFAAVVGLTEGGVSRKIRGNRDMSVLEIMEWSRALDCSASRLISWLLASYAEYQALQEVTHTCDDCKEVTAWDDLYVLCMDKGKPFRYYCVDCMPKHKHYSYSASIVITGKGVESEHTLPE